MIFCKNCGAQLEDSVTFCTQCGIRLTKPAAPTTVSEPKPVSAPAAEAAPAPEKISAPAPEKISASEAEAVPMPEEGSVPETKPSSAGDFVESHSAPPMSETVLPPPVGFAAGDSAKEKTFFGVGALVFCLVIIGALSVATGVFAGLYFSAIA